MTESVFKNLLIEPTNYCNLSCPICPIGSGEDKRKKGFMAFKNFKKIVDSGEDFLEFFQFSGYGEPFLSPDMGKMIRYVGEKNFFSGIFTNGVILDKKKMELFKKNYKCKVTFSIDGISQKSYNYYRRDGNLKKALANLSYLVDLKKKNNLSNLEVIWQFLVMKTNEHEIEEAVKLAKKIGVNHFKLKAISIYETHPRYLDFAPRDKKYRRQKKLSKGCQFIEPGMPFILWNGDVVPCCVSYKKEYVMGNAFKEDLLNIWNSKKYKKFREEYVKGINFLCNKRCRYGQK